MATVREVVISVERGIKTCQHEGCKTDAIKKVTTTECKKGNNGLEAVLVTKYLCKKHFQQLGIEETEQL